MANKILTEQITVSSGDMFEVDVKYFFTDPVIVEIRTRGGLRIAPQGDVLHAAKIKLKDRGYIFPKTDFFEFDD